MCESNEGQAGTQIVITPAMIEAGVDCLFAKDRDYYGPREDPKRLVSEIVETVLAARFRDA